MSEVPLHVDLKAWDAIAWPIRGWVLKGVYQELYLSTKGVNTGVPR